MGYLDLDIITDLDNNHLVDFNTELQKINNLPFSFLNTIKNSSLEYSEKIEEKLLDDSICYDSIHTEELKSHKLYKDKKGFSFFWGVYRMNPIARYEAFQFYRLNHILLHVAGELEEYINLVIFELSFQITFDSKVKRLQKEINKVLENINLKKQSYAFALMYNKLHRENHYIRSYHALVNTFISNIKYNSDDDYELSQYFKIILCYVSDGFNNDYNPLSKRNKKWIEFELNHYKLLMLRRLEKSVSLIDDFFSKDKIELNNPISLTSEDTSFFTKLSLILKHQKDQKFLSSVLKDDEIPRTRAFFDNLYFYLHDSNSSKSRLNTVGSSSYVNIINSCYPSLSNFVVSSNGLNDKWTNNFKKHDKI